MDIVYESISLTHRDKSYIWTMNGPFSPSLTAGLVIAGNLSLSWVKSYGWEYFTVEYFDSPTRHIKERVNHSYDIAIDVVIFTNTPVYHISYSYTIAEADPSKYAIWIFNGYFRDDDEHIELFDLYEFNTCVDLVEFAQGISTICNAFNIDITKIILACPIHNKYSYHIGGINLPILVDDDISVN